MTTETRKAETAGGLAVIGCLAAGFAALFGAIAGFFSLNVIGVGVCLAAAGISFGLAANAIFRD